jgi:SOS response regulatory protein OraA/RecX
LPDSVKPTSVDPIDTAAKALRHRDRPRRWLDERLAKAGVDEESRADALDTLERVGYVNDERYAATRAATLAERGQGDAAIRFALEQEGVGADLVEAALVALEPERERARAEVARLGATLKVRAQLARKGFDEDSLEGLFAVEDSEA